MAFMRSIEGVVGNSLERERVWRCMAAIGHQMGISEGNRSGGRILVIFQVDIKCWHIIKFPFSGGERLRLVVQAQVTVVVDELDTGNEVVN